MNNPQPDMRWDEQAQRWAVWNPQATRWEWTTPVTPQQVVQAGPSMSVTRQKEPMAHTAHLILSILTCGLWLPGWWLLTVLHGMSRGRKVKTTYR